MILGFDTSTAATSVCLLHPGGAAAVERSPAPARLHEPPAHASELMPAVAAVMDEAGARFTDLEAIAVGIGPGTFTGLRIGIATARALAVASRLPLRPVSSLAALAAGVLEEDEPALALTDARRGQVFAALHDRGGVLWEPLVATPEELGERLRNSSLTPLAAGDGSIRFREVVEAAGATVAPDGSQLHVVRALHVCRLAARGPDVAPQAVLPLYLREPDAKPRSR